MIDIPATMVGKLVGKAGETIKQLQDSTNTKVRIKTALTGLKQKTGGPEWLSAMSICRRVIWVAAAYFWPGC